MTSQGYDQLLIVVQPSGEPMSLEENVAMISEGTTGLVTWEAALYLAEWALENTHVFTGKYVSPSVSLVPFTYSVQILCFFNPLSVSYPCFLLSTQHLFSFISFTSIHPFFLSYHFFSLSLNPHCPVCFPQTNSLSSLVLPFFCCYCFFFFHLGNLHMNFFPGHLLFM